MTLKTPIPGLLLSKEIAGLLRHDVTQHWAVVLPGMWGVDDLLSELRHDRPVLRIDGALNGSEAREAVAESLSEQGFRASTEVAGGVLSWLSSDAVQSHGGSAVVFIESAHLVDTVVVTLIDRVLREHQAQVVMAVPSSVELPEVAARAQRTGALDVLERFLLTPRELEAAVRRSLGGEVSTRALHRIGSLSGGHALLAQQTIALAQVTGVLHEQGGLWTWSADETPFTQEVSRQGPHLLSGFAASEKELMVLLAVVGRLPYQWAEEHFGDGTVRILRAQHVMGIDHTGPLAFRDLRLTAELLRHAADPGVRGAEITRLWYSVGKQIPIRTAGPGAVTALTWWRARAEGTLDVETAEQEVPYAMSRGWYAMVEELVGLSEVQSTRMRLYKARAERALGRVDDAFATLESVAEDCAEADIHAKAEGTDQAAVREEATAILLVARQWSVCHPDRAAEVIARIEQQWSEPLLPRSDAILASFDEEDVDSALAAVTAARELESCDEAATVQLMLGSYLGLRQHPQLGRLVLSSLVDDLSREGGAPDIEELAVALLVMVTTVQGWSVDIFRVNVQTWHGRRISDPALPAVADVVAAVVAMQGDRMELAHEYSVSAVRTFGEQDRFGLRPFAAAVAVASSSYVDPVLSQSLRIEFTEMYGSSSIHHGMPFLRRLTQGLVMVGSGPPTEVIADHLVDMAAEARESGEWAQEQQLLLLALLGGSVPAARAVLASPWQGYGGRPRMIGLMAQAVMSDDPWRALDIADTLLGAGAMHLGLMVLSWLWQAPSPEHRDVHAQVVRRVRACERARRDSSWLISTFGLDALSSRERAVIRGLTEGDSTRAVAAALHVSQRTVEATVSALLKRFRCANRLELLALDLLSD